jgi:hypothetical protein
MTSSNTSPLRLRKIEKPDLELHSYLSEADECYYLYEYTSRRGFDFSPVNSLIHNLKKCPERFRGTNVWPYKEGAIRQCGEDFRRTINPEFVRASTFVPIPPSKAKDDPKFDDRMSRVARIFSPDVRDMVIQTASTQASHASGDGQRISIAELVKLYQFDEALTSPTSSTIGVIDDVLTNGTHFKAMQQVLRGEFPKARIVGFFVARRIFPTEAVI